jgi:hypothetical protein
MSGIKVTSIFGSLINLAILHMIKKVTNADILY